jgi:hypothetical protein
VARQDLFTMRVTPEERQLIARLAAQEQRSAADAIRRLIHRAVAQHDERTPQPLSRERALVRATDP